MKEETETLTTELPVRLEKEVTSLSTSNIFGNKDSFDHAQRVAIMLSKSELVPKRYQNNVGNCMIALEMSGRIGANILMVMQNLDIILGKPAWSSKFLIATINASGKFSPLRYEEDKNTDGGRMRAWAYDKAHGNEKIFGAWVSMNMAKAEGWFDKNGSKWKTMPELMLRYRAASFFSNQYCPEISMGIQTVEEVQDVPYVEVSDVTVDDLMELFELKKDALTPTDAKRVKEVIDTKETKSYKKFHDFLKSK